MDEKAEQPSKPKTDMKISIEIKDGMLIWDCNILNGGHHGEAPAWSGDLQLLLDIGNKLERRIGEKDDAVQVQSLLALTNDFMKKVSITTGDYDAAARFRVAELEAEARRLRKEKSE
jgi:hypothetical protein